MAALKKLHGKMIDNQEAISTVVGIIGWYLLIFFVF